MSVLESWTIEFEVSWHSVNLDLEEVVDFVMYWSIDWVESLELVVGGGPSVRAPEQNRVVFLLVIADSDVLLENLPQAYLAEIERRAHARGWSASGSYRRSIEE